MRSLRETHHLNHLINPSSKLVTWHKHTTQFFLLATRLATSSSLLQSPFSSLSLPSPINVFSGRSHNLRETCENKPEREQERSCRWASWAWWRRSCHRGSGSTRGTTSSSATTSRPSSAARSASPAAGHPWWMSTSTRSSHGISPVSIHKSIDRYTHASSLNKSVKVC